MKTESLLKLPEEALALPPQQLAFGQSLAHLSAPAEEAAAHWQAVYRLTKALRYPSKTKRRRSRARAKVDDGNLVPTHSEHPQLPEFEFSAPPDKKDLDLFSDGSLISQPSIGAGSSIVQDTRQKPIHAPSCRQFSQGRTLEREPDADAGSIICRHLIAALRIEYAQSQEQS